MKREIHGSTDVTSHFIEQAWVLANASAEPKNYFYIKIKRKKIDIMNIFLVVITIIRDYKKKLLGFSYKVTGENKIRKKECLIQFSKFVK